MSDRLKYGSFTALQIAFMLFLSMHVLSSWHWHQGRNASPFM